MAMVALKSLPIKQPFTAILSQNRRFFSNAVFFASENAGLTLAHS